MEINSLAGYFFFGITDFVFFLCGGSHVESSLLPKFALLFCTCRHAWTPGVERRPERHRVRVPGGRHEPGAVLYRLALRAALVHRRPGPCSARDLWALVGAGGNCHEHIHYTSPHFFLSF